MKRAVFMVPAAIAFVYAAILAVEGIYIGLIAGPEFLVGYGFDSQSPEWRFRSRGHFFWYDAAVATVFAVVGMLLRRLLADSVTRP
ncbi:MAG TPA: hypothetical protein EYQ66_08550 [Myxococcales bacterium]|nr:hypothetical protein [Myxococcales bacterium]